MMGMSNVGDVRCLPKCGMLICKMLLDPENLKVRVQLEILHHVIQTTIYEINKTASIQNT